MEINRAGAVSFSNIKPTHFSPAEIKKEVISTPADGFQKSEATQDKSLSALILNSNSLRAKESGETGESRVLQGISTKQYADSYGRVTHLALQLSSYVGGNARNQVLNAYKTLFTQMEPDTKFTVVVESDRDRQDIEKMMKANNIANPERIKFIKPQGGESLTVWARDEMVCMFAPDKPGTSVVLNQTTLHSWHNDDTKIPPYIVKEHPHLLLDKEPRIVTDGGDVASNRNQSFVGYYSLASTAEKLRKIGTKDQDLKNNLIKYYENHFGGEVVENKDDKEVFPFKFVPTSYPQGTHRLDFEMIQNPDYKPVQLKSGQVSEAEMYEGLARKLFAEQFGKEILVMGKDDPNTPQFEKPASDHLDMGLTPVDDQTCTLGDPRLTKKIFKSMSPSELKQAETQLSQMAGKKVDLKSIVNDDRWAGDDPHNFDMYEKQLTEKGLNVIRLPHAEQGWGTPYISYNNCLMERFEKDGKEFRRIFLPVYGIDKLDNYAINTYKQLGFEVHPIRLDALSVRAGALRCISNWLERTPQG